MEIKKIFTSTGLNGIKELTFKNLTNDSSGKSGTGINLIYFTNVTSINYSSDENNINGLSFLAHAKNKTYFNSFIIPPSFVFYNHRVSTLKYSKFFKTTIAKKSISGRVLKTIPLTKTEILQKSSFYDLTSLGESFKTVSGISEIKAINEFMNLLLSIIKEYHKTFYKKDTYLLLETDYDNKEILDMFLKFYRIKNTLIDLTSIPHFKGIMVKVKNNYYPLTEIKTSLNGDNLVINLQALNKINKMLLEEHKKDLLSAGLNLDEDVEDVKDVKDVKEIKVFDGTKIKSKDKTLKIKEELLDKFTEVKELNKGIKDPKADIKINNILNQANEIITKNTSKSSGNENTKKDSLHHDKILNDLEKDPKFAKYLKEVQMLKDINFKFNGSIKVQRANLPKNLYYDPIKATGIETYTSYNKQQTEFNEVLDEAMFDLFKSLEIDKDAGLKVQDVKIYFEDNIKNRFKIYKVKLKNTKFGYEKPYEIQLKVPYPSHGKYIKLDSNKYIMINQLFPYPILKIQPNTVRIYTHFSTAAVELKGSNVNLGTNDLNRIKDAFLINLTEAKLKVKTQDLDDQKVQRIKDKYNLPSDLNDKLFTNIEIG